MPARAWQRFAIATLATCLGISCERDSSSHLPRSNEALIAPGQTDESIILRSDNVNPLQVFAGKSFYQQRVEPEEVLIGILLEAHVREGPNTRDMPFNLMVGEDVFNVYLSGVDEQILWPYVGYEVVIVGKRIDQSREGYGIEIWIATISALVEN